MKRLFSIAFALVAVTSLAAADASKADLERWVAFLDKLVDTVVQDKADCTKMATDLNAVMDANKDLMEKAKEHRGEKLPKDVEEHVKEKMKTMFGALQEKCMNDKGVQAAIERMGNGKRRDKK